MSKSVFITGATGYIGGTILDELLQNHRSEYRVTALVRSQASATKVQSAGASVIIGSYDQPEILTNAAKDFDIIIHTGDSADHLGAAQAITRGISQRPTSSAPLIYIHTSGTGVLADTSHGTVEGHNIYDDLNQDAIDALDLKQPHRVIDVHVRDQAKELGNRSKTVIIIPPNIYGIGTGPVNQISIQTPTLIRFALKHHFAPQVGSGINWWNNVHVKDLARGYVILLKNLEKTNTLGWNGYRFAETGEHRWKDIYVTLAKVLHSKGLIDAPRPESPAKRLGYKEDFEAVAAGSGEIYDSWGSNSRGRASYLHNLGWNRTECDVLSAIESEVDYIRQHESD